MNTSIFLSLCFTPINLVMDATRLYDKLFAVLEGRQNIPDGSTNDLDRFNDPFPHYSSGTTTKPPSLPCSPELFETPAEFERWLELRFSQSWWQFDHQVGKERARIIEQFNRRSDRRKEILPYSKHIGDYSANAQNDIKNDWIKQGIWNDKWTTFRLGDRWMHEEEPEPVIEYSPEPEPDPKRSTIPRPLFTPRTPTLEKRMRIKPVTAEQRATHVLETAASRPLPQFLYQISKEPKPSGLKMSPLKAVLILTALLPKMSSEVGSSKISGTPDGMICLETSGCMKSLAK